MKYLNQVIAVEKSIKSRVYASLTKLHRINEKIDFFNGFTKTYRKKDEEGEDFPPEKKNILISAKVQIETMKNDIIEILDITAKKDYCNCDAKADIIIDGVKIAEKVPATYLLFLEKQINDLRTFAEGIPILDPAENWTYDVNSGTYKTEAITTHKSKKVQKPIILSEATKEHPAQTQLVSEDIVVGYWDTVKFSGAMPIPDKMNVLDRINKLSKTIKIAREKANTTEAKEVFIGKNIFDYIFVSQAKN